MAFPGAWCWLDYLKLVLICADCLWHLKYFFCFLAEQGIKQSSKSKFFFCKHRKFLIHSLYKNRFNLRLKLLNENSILMIPCWAKGNPKFIPSWCKSSVFLLMSSTSTKIEWQGSNPIIALSALKRQNHLAISNYTAWVNSKN